LKLIALLGGTFDPVHYGHIGLARAAFIQLEAQSLTLLPAGNPYQRGRLPIASSAHRVNMLALAFQLDSQVRVDERELRRGGATYTYDTLAEIRSEVGEDASLVWMIGSDAFSRLETWHRWWELFGLAHFAVIGRTAVDVATAKWSMEFTKEIEPRLAGLPEAQNAPSGAVILLGSPPPAVSSTDIRERIASKESIRGLTPDAVCDYIEQHKLYLSKEIP
jgi:nicotinate-nucleotide adenylyltransferase